MTYLTTSHLSELIVICLMLLRLAVVLFACCEDRIAHFVCFLNFFVFHWFYKHFQRCGRCINGVEWCKGGMCGGQESTGASTWRLQKCDCRIHIGKMVFALKVTWGHEWSPGADVGEAWQGWIFEWNPDLCFLPRRRAWFWSRWIRTEVRSA